MVAMASSKDYPAEKFYVTSNYARLARYERDSTHGHRPGAAEEAALNRFYM